MKNLTTLLIASLAWLALPVAQADDSHHAASAKPGAVATQNTADMADGEVRKIDKANNKITLKHGAIKNLEMPGMTMVFRIKDPSMLENLQIGDKLKFKAERINGAIVVTEAILLK